MKIFDAHFHIVDPRFPLVENNGYLPDPFLVNDYKQSFSKYTISGGAVVSGSFQAFDQTYLIDSLNLLGDNFYGVANIAADTPKQLLDELNNSNVVAVRFNVKRGGSESLDKIEYLSNYLYDLYQWHTELYIENKDLPALRSLLGKLPKFSIDHLGLTCEGISELLYWVERGIKVKATGFGRIENDPVETMRQIHSINPGALMFGSDLPSTRSKMAFTEADIDLIMTSFDQADLSAILYDNAQGWYTSG
ncbi:amidohydrolase family protein [Dyadobacter sandarakinus]|uniref:Amidohydrolase family protein n=1 Tax=Dyadobacter sandarakinus TaxID=2747268 RepID=A0ABX7I4I1_9BACT|nr:amidohydrolase family protein [Dyadobacter sandarakinus]QRR00845.1 amidohydrolase family protein [Dyadobacter sandarakinus]